MPGGSKTIQRTMIRLFIIFILIVSAQSIRAQPTEYDIRMSGDYYWGEAVSLDRSEAVSLARSDLIGRIVTIVVADQTHGITEDDEEFSTFYASATRTISRMELRGLDHKVSERRDGSFSALAWLHRDDYNRSIEIERERQLGLAAHAAQIEREDGLNRAIPFLYRAFLSTYYFPEPLYLRDESGRSIEAREYYRRKLDRWAAGIEVTAGRPDGGVMPGDVVEIGIPLQFYSAGQVASDVEVGLDIAGYGARQTTGGQTRLFLERLPNKLQEDHAIRFRPALEDTRANRDWMVLAGEAGPFYRRNISIDFSPIVTVDFDAQRIADNTYRFTNRIENLSISHIEWDFGDGTSSHEWNPAHQFAGLDPAPVITLRLNRDPDLEIRKELTPRGLRPVARDPRPRERTVSARDRETPPPDRVAMPDPSVRQTFSWNRPGLTPEKRRFLRELSSQTDAGEILRSLQTHARSLDLQYGNRSVIRLESDSFVVIVDPQNYDVKAFLSPVQDGGRFDLLSGRRIINFEETYRGLGSVWIEP